jgi:hypothetical protein
MLEPISEQYKDPQLAGGPWCNLLTIVLQIHNLLTPFFGLT